MKVRLLLMVIMTLFYVSPAFAAETPEVKLVARWAQGPAGPVTGNADRHLVFLGAGSVLNILDDNLSKISTFVTTSEITSIFSDSDRLYLGNKEKVLIIDVKDPEHPELLGEYAIPSASVAVEGTHLYSLGYDGVTIFDISTPGDIKITTLPEGNISFSREEYRPGKIRVKNNLLYLLPDTFCDRFIIYDVSDPSNPILESSTEIAGNDFHISDLNAYIVNNTGLEVLDISNPKAPAKITENTFELDGSPKNIFISGHFAYIGCYRNTTWILDISNPSVPVTKGLLPTFVSIDMYVANDKAYASIWSEGLRAYDVTHPVNGFYNSKEVEGIQTPGDMAYVLYNDELVTLDCSETNGIKELSTFPLELWFDTELERSGNHLFVIRDGDGERTILSIDVSNPSLPQRIGHATLKSEGPFYYSDADATFSGDLALIGSVEGTFLFDFKDKNQLKEIAKLSDGRARKILVHENHVYIVEHSDSPTSPTLKIVNVSTPSQPLNIPFDSPDNIRDIEITGNLIHVLTSDKLYVYDLSNPENITESGSYPLSQSFSSVQARDSAVYLLKATAMKEIYIYDLSDSSRLEFVTSLSNRDSTLYNYFRIGNQKAFFPGRNGLHIFDISNPEKAPLDLFFETPDAISDIDVFNNHIYGLDGFFRDEGPGPKGFHVIDIADKKQPEEKRVFKYDNSMNPLMLKRINDYVFGISDNDLEFIDISDPLSPVEMDHDFAPQEKLSRYVTGIDDCKNEIFISHGSSEIDVINVSDLSTPVQGTPIAGNSMVVAGASGYVVNGSVLRVLDLENPQKQTLGSVDLKNEILQMHVNPPYACVISKAGGAAEDSGTLDLKILDVSDPSKPFVTGACAISDLENHYEQRTYMREVNIQVGENYVYLSDVASADGIRVIDIKDPQKPHETARVKTFGQPYDIIFSDGYLYVADGTGGITIFNNTDDTPETDNSRGGGGGGCFITSLFHE